MSQQTSTVWGLGVVAELVFTRVIKQVDETRTNDTTLSDDAELTIPLKANTVYFFVYSQLHAGDPAGDIKSLFSIPAGATMIHNNNWTSGGNTTVDTTVLVISSTDGSTRQRALWGRITTGATAGAVTFRWAQNTANPIPSIIERGSSLIVWE